MYIGSPEHRKLQEENGRKMRERLEKEVAAGPKSKQHFDQVRFLFARNLLNSLNGWKING